MRDRLRNWCRENSVEKMAVRCDVTAGYILKIISGTRNPSRKLAKRIDKVTKGELPWRQWEEGEHV